MAVLSKVKGFFSNKVYFGDLFIPEEKLEALQKQGGTALEDALEAERKKEWLVMREPTILEKKALMGFTNIDEKFLSDRTADEIIKLIKVNSNSSVDMMDSMNNLLSACVESYTLTEDDGVTLSPRDVVIDVFMSNSIIYTRMMEAFTGALGLKKKNNKKLEI